MWHRGRLVPRVAAAAALAATTVSFTSAPPTAVAVVPRTIVTIEWHDGNADQIALPAILDRYGMRVTFLVNTGPILAGDPAKLSVADLHTLYDDQNEIAGHTLDHVNVQPLSTADARYEVCTDRDNLLTMGFQPTSLAYPFASFDDGSEDVAHFCGYNGASATAGLALKKPPFANTVPPADPYAVRTVNAIKKSTKLTTMERYVSAAESTAQNDGTAWTIFVFHHLCGAHDHCGAYVISPEKFEAFLQFLQGEAGDGLVVETMQQVIGGTVRGSCDPVTGTGSGCDVSPR